MSYKNGSIIGVDNTPMAGAASGVWDLNSVRDYREQGLWPGLGIDEWRVRTADQDVAFMTDVKMEGWNGSSWVTIDNFDPPSSNNTWTTRTNGVDFTDGTDYDDFRFVITLSGVAANFISEIEINKGGTDLTTGCSPTESPVNNDDQANWFDDNTSTKAPECQTWLLVTPWSATPSEDCGF